MVKCTKCAKLINKKSPGLQCGKCSKWLHADCTSITSDQLNALNSTESVDWKCKTCAGGLKPKRLSCIIRDDEGDENTDSEATNPETQHNITKQIIRELREEVKDVIREELQHTLQCYSDKIDDYEEKIKTYEKSNKSLEKQCVDLKNNLQNLNLKVEVLETKCNQLEQYQINNQLEVCGIKEKEKENTLEIAKEIAAKIGQSPENVVKTYRKKNNNRTSSTSKPRESAPIVVILREANDRDLWIDSAKNFTITRNENVEGDKIYLREALTPSTAHLLWKTKEALKGDFKYIWCKHGTILIRKNEKDKIIAIRTLHQVDQIKSSINCD